MLRFRMNSILSNPEVEIAENSILSLAKHKFEIFPIKPAKTSLDPKPLGTSTIVEQLYSWSLVGLGGKLIILFIYDSVCWN